MHNWFKHAAIRMTSEKLDAAAGTSYFQKLPKTPAEALFVIDRFLRSRILGSGGKTSAAVLINFAHMVAPREELTYMGQDDFRTVITLLKWANDPDFVKSDITVVLVTGNLQDLNESVVNNPFTSKVEIPLPNEEERREFVQASLALGVSSQKIIWRHLLPNCLAPIIVAITLSIGSIILYEAILSFIGLGIQPPIPSWGNMLHQALEYIRSAPLLAIYPGIIILLTVVSINFIGDGLRDAFDPRFVA